MSLAQTDRPEFCTKLSRTRPFRQQYEKDGRQKHGDANKGQSQRHTARAIFMKPMA